MIKDRIARLIKNSEPQLFKKDKTAEDVFCTCAFYYMGINNLSTDGFYQILNDEPYTIETLEKNYEQFHESAIINDGQLIGFKKEKAL